MGDVVISITDLQGLISTTFFDGNAEAAALLMFAVVMLGILALVKRPFLALVVMIPVTVLFNLLGVLPTDLTLIMVVIVVMGLGITSSKAFK